MNRMIGISALALASLCACATAKPAETPAAPSASSTLASAKLEPRSGSEVSGTATFVASNGQVTLTVALENLSPGEHAVHLHDKGDCSAADASSAGPHWNPTAEPHGKWGATPHHLGDVGNVDVDASGHGTLTLTTDKWSIGTGASNDIVGHALVVHGGADDFTSQPAGNAGKREACGVVTAGALAK